MMDFDNALPFARHIFLPMILKEVHVDVRYSGAEEIFHLPARSPYIVSLILNF